MGGLLRPRCRPNPTAETVETAGEGPVNRLEAREEAASLRSRKLLEELLEGADRCVQADKSPPAKKGKQQHPTTGYSRSM